MRFKQITPVKHTQGYRLYSPNAMTRAFFAVKNDNIPVLKASKLFGVPETTLRDRVAGRIHVDCVTTGRAPILDLDEEAKIVEHLQSVAKYGYGYTRQEVTDIATDYAVGLGKRSDSKPLTLNWFHGFIKRWPELRVIKPRALELTRAKGASETVVSSYFDNLEDVLKKYNLVDKPHLVFNVDEKGITQNHSPPYIVSGKGYNAQCVTAGKSSTTTVIGCGSASGVAIPPFFVFSGVRKMPDLMKDASPGAACTMSDNGWSNTNAFREWLQDHFVKFIPQREPGQHLLLLLDGHKSHVAVDLVEWAKKNNIIMLILPAHTSHILQPMDVGCYGPLQKIYNGECHKMTRTAASAVTRYDVCGLACKSYSKALSPENLRAAFSKTGICPLDRNAIDKHYLIPAEVFQPTDEVEPMETTVNDSRQVLTDDRLTHDSDNENTNNVNAGENEHVNDSLHDTEHGKMHIDKPSPSAFLNQKLISLKNTKAPRVKKQRKSISHVVSGQPITEPKTHEKLVQYVNNQSVSNSATKSKTRKGKALAKKVNKCKSEVSVQPQGIRTHNHLASPQPGPSHYYVSDSDSESEREVDESEKCCVCNMFTPAEIRRSVSLVFTKWVQCDACPHWVHLTYCTKQRVVRRGDVFLCPHCC